MDNQHKKITGYRDLSQQEINLMNEIKAQGEVLRLLHSRLYEATPLVDARWLDIGKAHLQQGIMALVRAVAQPTTF